MSKMSAIHVVSRFALSLAVLSALATQVEARAGSGGSAGSRGGRTFSAPAPTATAPRAAQPLNRTTTQPAPANQGLAQPATAGNKGGFFSGGFGRGLLGGLVGAGLFGLLSGSGLFGGMGGLTSIIGLLLQIGLIVLIVRLVMGFFRRKPVLAGAGGPSMFAGNSGPDQMNTAARPMPGPASAAAPLAISQNDYNTFEQRLGEVETAFGNEDINGLRNLVTPEMASYFEQELADNARRGVINRLGNIKLLQGDLSESWREADGEYATLAMRFGLIDATYERATNKLVAGNDNTPQEATEVWTFRRPAGAGAQAWKLSAIQQA